MRYCHESHTIKFRSDKIQITSKQQKNNQWKKSRKINLEKPNITCANIYVY
jgi:hypothetical protein